MALAPRLSDTFAIVKAPGLEGAAVQGYRYLTTDSRGYAIYDNLTPYRENTLMLDIADSKSDVALLGNRKNTVPYRGAVVMTQFETDKRKPRYFISQRPDGSPLPFGYEVEDESSNNVGLVGQEVGYLFAPMMFPRRFASRLINSRNNSALLPLITLLMRIKFIFVAKGFVYEEILVFVSTGFAIFGQAKCTYTNNTEATQAINLDFTKGNEITVNFNPNLKDGDYVCDALTDKMYFSTSLRDYIIEMKDKPGGESVYIKLTLEADGFPVDTPRILFHPKPIPSVILLIIKK